LDAPELKSKGASLTLWPGSSSWSALSIIRSLSHSIKISYADYERVAKPHVADFAVSFILTGAALMWLVGLDEH
jgi:hypothetical protein